MNIKITWNHDSKYCLGTVYRGSEYAGHIELNKAGHVAFYKLGATRASRVYGKPSDYGDIDDMESLVYDSVYYLLS